MKILKSKKALSPVVASIILIAVTVAVSIAVAAWMGALTFTFMKTEEIKITGISWGTNYVNLTVTNTGASDLTITGAKVDGSSTNCYHSDTLITPTAGYLLVKGTSEIIKVNKPSGNWVSGTKYNFALLTASGNQYPYSDTYP